MVKENFSLKKYNTFGIDVMAQYFAGFSTIEQLEELLEFEKLKINNPKSSTFILGGGSNILFTKNVEGVVLKNEIKGIETIGEDENYVYLKAGAGENWHQLVLYCINNNLAGMENLSLIPGNVGASPMQNIGAYGVEIKDVFHQLEAFHLLEKKIVRFAKDDCKFGYRESIFKGELKDQFVILNVTYRLNKIPHFNTSYGAIEQELQSMGIKEFTIQAISQAVINIRSSKLPDPAVVGNAGSFFKNPEIDNEQFLNLRTAFSAIVGYDLHNGKTKLAAGWLIEQCGWKGKRVGNTGCYERQALVLVNYGGATGKEVKTLAYAIIDSVEERFGVRLEAEVNMV